MLRLAVAAALSLALVGAAQAQKVSGARVVELGVYSAQLKKDPDDSERTYSAGYKLIKGGSNIDSGAYQPSQFEDGVPRVGFWWYLRGSPHGSEVQIKIVQTNPNGKVYDTMWPRNLGERAWNGMRVNDWKGAVGKTLFQVWYGSQKLFEVTFTVR